MKEFYIGLDLGQHSADYTALALAERHWPDEAKGETFPLFGFRFLHRYPLGTRYPAIIEDLAKMLARDELKAADVTLAIDQTGVGAAVVNQFKRAELKADIKAVQITNGIQANWENGAWNIPRRELVSVVQVGLQGDRMKIAAELEYASLLTEELKNFKAKIVADAAADTVVWRETSNEDLVLAVALAMYAGKDTFIPQEPFPSFSQSTFG
jgi:hypothetical protein